MFSGQSHSQTSPFCRCLLRRMCISQPFCRCPGVGLLEASNARASLFVPDGKPGRAGKISGTVTYRSYLAEHYPAPAPFNARRLPTLSVPCSYSTAYLTIAFNYSAPELHCCHCHKKSTYLTEYTSTTTPHISPCLRICVCTRRAAAQRHQRPKRGPK